MANPLKIFVCGDVEGHFTVLFNRIKSVQKKMGPFDILFCTGDFFGSDDTEWKLFKSGDAKVPIPTFVLGPNREENMKYFPDPDGGELCENVTYLGRRGIYTGASGLTVAYLSGLEGSGHDVYFKQADIDALCIPRTHSSNFKGVDILLTSPWPKDVSKYGIKPDGVDGTKCGSAAIAQLALKLIPRYHFSAVEGVYYERQPYRNHKVLQESPRHVTRFLSLARVGNSQKKKYLYAFNITPMKQIGVIELTKQPEDVTECPFKEDIQATRVAADKAAEKEGRETQFFFDPRQLDRKVGAPGNKRKSYDNRDGPQMKKQHAQPTGPCWFCLSSPEVEKHLVISIGEQCYLTLAKGCLVRDHLLILPIGHHQSTVAAPVDILKEIEGFKSALRKCFKAQDKAVVFYERNYKSSHLQIQAVPIPVDLADDVKDTFQECARQQKFELAEIPRMTDLKQVIPAGAPYFYVELPSGDKLLFRISKGFPLQFGREAMVHQKLLNMPERVDWRNCKYTSEEETLMARTFRKLFKPVDPTIKEDL